ncbi:MAG: YoaK family protein [Pseudomonadota bacterium]
MIRYDRRTRLLAAALSALAGYIDAIGFMASGGFFISFMSGNSTKLGVGLATLSADARTAAGLIATFLIGVVLGSMLGSYSEPHRRSAVLLLVTVTIVAAASCAASGFLAAGLVLTALAMGAENAVFEEDGEIRIGLTYMTGTLVKLGQRLAAAARGGARWGWAPYLVQWCGLLCGAIAGAFAYSRIGMASLWWASAAAAASLAVAWLLERPRATA